MSALASTERLDEPTRTRFLDLYVRACVDPTTSLTSVCDSAGTTSPFKPLLQKLTQEHFAGAVLPPLTRALKAKTLPAMSAVASLFSLCSLDASRYVNDVFVPVITSSASSAKDEARAAVLPLIKALVAKCRLVVLALAQ